VSHGPHCIRSDGDWICRPPCTHDADEARAAYNDRITGENATMRRVLTEIAQGHPNPVLHAASTLASLNSEEGS